MERERELRSYVNMHNACNIQRRTYVLLRSNRTFSYTNSITMNAGEKLKSIAMHRKYSSDADADIDASTIQVEFNMLVNDLSSTAFDLSFEELLEGYNKLEEQMKQMAEKNVMVHDMEYVLNTVQKLMSTCSRLGTVDGAELTEKYLTLLLSSDLSGRTENGKDVIVIAPNRQCFTLAINCWSDLSLSRTSKQDVHAHARARSSAYKAQQILDFMWEEYDKGEGGSSNHAVKPDIIHYTSVIKALINASSQKATIRAFFLLREADKKSGLEDLIRDSDGDSDSSANADAGGNSVSLQELDPNLVPDRVAYNTILNGLARFFLGRKDIHIREVQHFTSDYIMRQMKIVTKRMEVVADILNDESWNPNTESYNSLLMACSRHPDRTGDEAEEILKTMIEQSAEHAMHVDIDDLGDLEENSVVPTVKSYNHILNSVSVARAEEILRAMVRRAPSGESGESVITDNPFLNESKILPDVVSFNMVLNAYAKSGLPDAGRRAEAILDFMDGTQALSSGYAFITDHYNTKNINITPDAISYNNVISAWSKSDDDDRAERAQACLDRFIARSMNESIMKPNSISFFTVMEAWCDAAITSKDKSHYDNAIRIFYRMKKETSLHPNAAKYNPLISIPSKVCVDNEESRFDMSLKAKEILMELIECDTTDPDIYSFNHAIKGFQGYHDDHLRRESMFAVLDVFNVLLQSPICNPNAQTYIHGTYL